MGDQEGFLEEVISKVPTGELIHMKIKGRVSAQIGGIGEKLLFYYKLISTGCCI